MPTKEKYYTFPTHRTPKSLREGVDAYAEKLSAMSDEELFSRCASDIYMSAYAENNIKSDYHWMCDMTYDESKARDSDIYKRAHEQVSKANF